MILKSPTCSGFFIYLGLHVLRPLMVKTVYYILYLFGLEGTNRHLLTSIWQCKKVKR